MKNPLLTAFLEGGILIRSRLHWRYTPSNRVICNDELGSMTERIFTYGAFQVERIVMNSWCRVPLHVHPNVDSYELPLWGYGEIWIRKRTFILDENVTPFKPLYIPRNCPHGGRGFETGGAFLSVQYWHTGEPLPIEKDWLACEDSLRR